MRCALQHLEDVLAVLQVGLVARRAQRRRRRRGHALELRAGLHRQVDEILVDDAAHAVARAVDALDAGQRARREHRADERLVDHGGRAAALGDKDSLAAAAHAGLLQVTLAAIVQGRAGDSARPAVADTIGSMGVLYLVRHGQASFGAADYDQLSEWPHQCERLGAWFSSHGIVFDAVLTGTLKRHRQSLEAIETGLARQHEALRWPGLNEYDPEALVRAVHGERARRADPPKPCASTSACCARACWPG